MKKIESNGWTTLEYKVVDPPTTTFILTKNFHGWYIDDHGKLYNENKELIGEFIGFSDQLPS